MSSRKTGTCLSKKSEANSTEIGISVSFSNIDHIGEEEKPSLALFGIVSKEFPKLTRKFGEGW